MYIISDNMTSQMIYLTPDVKVTSLLLKPLKYYQMAEKGIRESIRKAAEDMASKDINEEDR